ncbi:MAG: endonuclease/exonuclease/phosphatase family protein [Bacteroidales bacterium]
MNNFFMPFRWLLMTIVIVISSVAFAQKQRYAAACVGFYNLENLFDTIKSPNTNDTEFLPSGKNLWNTQRYQHKLHNMASVIRKLGTEFSPNGLAVLGVAEIENREVLEDLIVTPPLKDIDYGIVHYDSPDGRGVDVGMLYQKNRFRVLGSRSARLFVEGMPNFRTRDQLVVSGLLDGDLVHIIIVHWPSRYGGEKRSRPLRMAAAELSRTIIDSLYKLDDKAKIILMGDMNDDPDNHSMTKVLQAKAASKEVKVGGLYNTMYKLFDNGVGTLAWNDAWNLFDQIVISQPLIADKNMDTYQFYRARIFNEDFLKQKDGRFAGYPFRTFAGGAFLGGYSDHFPVYIVLLKKVKEGIPSLL